MNGQEIEVTVSVNVTTYHRLSTLAQRTGFKNVSDFSSNFFGVWVSTPSSDRPALIRRILGERA